MENKWEYILYYYKVCVFNLGILFMALFTKFIFKERNRKIVLGL